MKLPFYKMQALGNDFVIIDARQEAVDLSDAQRRSIAHRRFGVGCDQLAILKPSEKADLFMEIYNASGGEVGACGNMTRCVARLLCEELQRDNVTIETQAGVLPAVRIDKILQEYQVDMGKPSFDWQEIPLSKDVDTLSLPLSGNPVAVNVGNPHCVFFVDDLEAINLEKEGAY